MRAEGDAVFTDLAQLAQAEDLKSTRIGEDGPRPGHETVQTAELADLINSGTQVEVVGIAKQNLNSQLFE